MSGLPWGNIAIVVLLGTAYAVVSWFVSKKVQSADDFMTGKGKLGVAFGATSLLAFWITGNTIMAAPEAAFSYGILGAIGYGFLGGFAVVLFAPLAKRIHQILPNARTVGDFYSGRFDKKNYYLFLLMSIIYTIGLLMTQGIGGGLILEEIFGIPYDIAVILTFILVMIYATLGGFRSVTAVAFIQVLLIIVVVLIVPPVVYFKTGISPIYEGMLQFAPEKLSLNNHPGLMFMFAGLVMGVGEVFMDNTFWQRAYAINKKKTGRIFVISGIGWAFVPLGVATLAFVALGTNTSVPAINQIAPYIAKIYGGNFVGYLFLVCVWSALSSTIAGCLNSISSLLVNDVYLRRKPKATSAEQLKAARLLTLVVGLVAMVMSLPKLLSMLQMLVFFGVINGAYIFPITFGLFWKKLNNHAAFWSAVLAMVLGFIAYYRIGAFEGLLVSAYTSLIICLVGSWIKPAQFDWNTLQNIGLDAQASK